MIDIVTINKDNKDGLEKTILSVINQTAFDEINYIIIDGGSTDGSKEIIKKYKEYFGYSTSRKDKGIYNAMNKSLEHLKGDYVLFLNSGDYLVSETTIEEVLKHFDGTPIIYGDHMIEGHKKAVNLDGVTIMIYSKEPVLSTIKALDKVDEGYFKVNSLPHQSTFIKCDYMKLHPYSEKYRIISDWILFREAILDEKIGYKHIPMAVANFDLNGISSKRHDLISEEMNDYYKSKDK